MATPLSKLPIDQRLKLVDDLWDSIAAEEKTISLTEAQRSELGRRFEEFEMDGDLGQPGDIVLSEVRRGL